jgi:hypothetical protein
MLTFTALGYQMPGDALAGAALDIDRLLSQGRSWPRCPPCRVRAVLGYACRPSTDLDAATGIDVPLDRAELRGELVVSGVRSISSCSNRCAISSVPHER